MGGLLYLHIILNTVEDVAKKELLPSENHNIGSDCFMFFIRSERKTWTLNVCRYA